MIVITISVDGEQKVIVTEIVDHDHRNTHSTLFALHGKGSLATGGYIEKKLSFFYRSASSSATDLALFARATRGL